MKYLKELFSTNNILKYLIILVLVIVVVLSTTLAYYSWGSSANTNISFDVIADSVYIEYDGGADITGANLYPTDDKNDGIKKDITVRVEKESSSAKFNLYLDLKTLPNALRDVSFRYAIYQGSAAIKSGNFTETGVACSTNSTNHIVLLSNITPTTTLTTYTLYIWIDGVNYTNPDTMMNQSFEFTLHADGENVKNKTTIYDVMALNAVLDNASSEFVTSSTGISFSIISSDINGKGVYLLSSTASDTYPIYYYRGAVDNNNVLFANFCWKIVRTTETGGIKLIYNGVPSNGQCNNTGEASQIGKSAFNSSRDDNAYVGYMYGEAGSSRYAATHANTNPSTIKIAIDTWYQNNMTSYTSKLEDTVWCNDRRASVNGFGTKSTNYGAWIRLGANKTPSLECSQANDRFTVSTDNGNGALTYPVGLLTADEIAYAGGKQGTSNSTFYLNTGVYWWAGSPWGFDGSSANEVILDSRGNLNYYNVNVPVGVRPALSLAPGTGISSGSGKVDDPYVVN